MRKGTLKPAVMDDAGHQVNVSSMEVSAPVGVIAAILVLSRAEVPLGESPHLPHLRDPSSDWSPSHATCHVRPESRPPVSVSDCLISTFTESSRILCRFLLSLPLLRVWNKKHFSCVEPSPSWFSNSHSPRQLPTTPVPRPCNDQHRTNHV